jgi:dienelactone hydrolase
MLTRSFLSVPAALAFALVVSLAASPAWSQAPKTKTKPKGKDAPPEPEEVKLDANDGWQVHATYFPGKLKKEAVPFILLHGWKGQRGDMDPLARFLQSLGHAAISPDLRGHGQSNVRPVTEKTVDDPDDLRRPEIEATGRDIEACKKFLRQKNNEGELNLESLCVVGSEYSCILAMQWTAYDWSQPILPSYKNSQDVKAVVLLTPWQSHKGLTVQSAQRQLAGAKKISFLFVAGTEDSRGTADAKKLNTALEAGRPEMKRDDVKPEDRTVVFMQPETVLSGSKLLNPALKLDAVIGMFVKYRLVDRAADFPWSERKSPREQ